MVPIFCKLIHTLKAVINQAVSQKLNGSYRLKKKSKPLNTFIGVTGKFLGPMMV